MLSNKRVCIFVDGENFRHSIGDLFLDFNRANYLPRADWEKFFDWVACEVVGSDADRIRTYWYVVENIDFTPFDLSSARKDMSKLIRILSRDDDTKESIGKAAPEKREGFANQLADELEVSQRKIEKRFRGWINIQDAIARNYKAIEFRRAGSIKYNLFKKDLGSEKAVDVKLASDLINLKDIYDIAIIVSGDQDYVPAVDSIKDFGKRIVNVAFLTDRGHLLPGGARRLNQSTDWSREIKYSDSKKYLGF